ncbi:MAG TPA: DUF2501 domain-containing protein [Rhodopila sp.]|nr:DUF2501 domain-containing protein [Rhodopila sp.]
MRTHVSWLMILPLLVSLVPGPPAQAQLLDRLKGAAGTGQDGGGAVTNLGTELPPVDQASTPNIAGVLQYCVRNNYLNGGPVESVKNNLLSKVTGSGQGVNDSAYQAGNRGLLQTGNGQGYSLNGSGLKQQLAQKVCGLVLQHAKSLL